MNTTYGEMTTDQLKQAVFSRFMEAKQGGLINACIVVAGKLGRKRGSAGGYEFAYTDYNQELEVVYYIGVTGARSVNVYHKMRHVLSDNPSFPFCVPGLWQYLIQAKAATLEGGMDVHREIDNDIERAYLISLLKEA